MPEIFRIGGPGDSRLIRGPWLTLALALLSGLPAAAGLAQTLPQPQFAPTSQTETWDFWSRLELAGHAKLRAIMEAQDHQPAPFVTDGCSGGLSTAWMMIARLIPGYAAIHQAKPPWEACCIEHDRIYHRAGSATTVAASYRARLAADHALRLCVLDIGKERAVLLGRWYGVTEAQVAHVYHLVAEAMFDAVRLGGSPCNGLPWRWGYGYPGCF